MNWWFHTSTLTMLSIPWFITHDVQSDKGELGSRQDNSREFAVYCHSSPLSKTTTTITTTSPLAFSEFDPCWLTCTLYSWLCYMVNHSKIEGSQVEYMWSYSAFQKCIFYFIIEQMFFIFNNNWQYLEYLWHHLPSTPPAFHVIWFYMKSI